jgi:hypothetical protein
MLTIIRRDAWEPTAELGPRMTLPVGEVWLHHSVTPLTGDPLADMRTIERVGIERFGIFSYSWAYHRPSRSFLEGAGDTVGAHTGGRNSTSLGLVLIGNYEELELDDVGVADVREGIAWLIAGNRLRPGIAYPTGGHRDLKQTACPGTNAYRRIPELRSAAAPTPPLDEEDDPMPRIIWLKDPANVPHAYRVAGTVGKHLTWEAYQKARETDEEPASPAVGSSDVPAGTDVQGLYALMDGPCRNMPIDAVAADVDEAALAVLLAPVLSADVDEAALAAALTPILGPAVAKATVDEHRRRLEQ